MLVERLVFDGYDDDNGILHTSYWLHLSEHDRYNVILTSVQRQHSWPNNKSTLVLMSCACWDAIKELNI